MAKQPHWDPLERAVGAALLVAFMWMFEVRVTEVRRLQAYKHRWTRRYLYLDEVGRAYAPCGPARYLPVPLADALEDALRPWWEELDATPDEIADAHDAIERARVSEAADAA